MRRKVNLDAGCAREPDPLFTFYCYRRCRCCQSERTLALSLSNGAPRATVAGELVGLFVLCLQAQTDRFRARPGRACNMTSLILAADLSRRPVAVFVGPDFGPALVHRKLATYMKKSAVR